MCRERERGLERERGRERVLFDQLAGLIMWLITFMLVICHFNIYLTEAGVMNEAGYVYSIWNA